MYLGHEDKARRFAMDASRHSGGMEAWSPFWCESPSSFMTVATGGVCRVHGSHGGEGISLHAESRPLGELCTPVVAAYMGLTIGLRRVRSTAKRSMARSVSSAAGHPPADSAAMLYHRVAVGVARDLGWPVSFRHMPKGRLGNGRLDQWVQQAMAPKLPQGSSKPWPQNSLRSAGSITVNFTHDVDT